jgi:HEPN domain-containing protein
MRQCEAEARRWLAQAKSDLAFAEVGVREGFFAQACFICQQAGEKALKALHYRRGGRIVLGHSLAELLHDLLSDHPAESFSPRQAAEAVAYARQFVARAGTALGDGPH